MSLLGKQIRLVGLSMKGKSRIRENGEFWMVFAETDKLLFNPEYGMWLFIAPLNKDHNHKSSRWIHANNDSDFEVFLG